MRDTALTIVIAGLLLLVFKQPAVGAYLWAWLSLMNPHKLAFGFAHNFPFAQIVAITTLVVLLLTKKRYPFPANNPLMVLQITLLVWMTITSFFAWNTPEVVFQRWLFVAKIQIMLFATSMLLRGRKHIDILVWVVTLSVGFYGIKGGYWTVATGGGERVWGPPGSMIEDNNMLASALVTLVPLFGYLYQVQAKRYLRIALLISIVLVAFSILGSQSRGAFIALLVMALFMGLKGSHPVRTTLALTALLALAIPFMPETWYQRMETIQSFEVEGSAMSRMYSWTTLWNAAVDNPITGVGFRADYEPVYDRYAPIGPEFDLFVKQAWVAHSIYFQMLGEHGFVGLAIFLLLFVSTWIRAGQLARRTSGDPEFGVWVPKLMRMLQVSLIGYGAGGAFLSLAYFDLPYYLICLVVLVEATMQESKKASVSAPAVTVATLAQRGQSP